MAEPVELVQGFNFRVSLVLSTSAGPTSAPPPSLASAPSGGSGSTAAPAVGGSGAAPVGPGAAPGSGGQPPPRLGNGGFQECTGLDLETDLSEHLEGGRNDGLVRGIGRLKLQPLVLKRGMLIATPGGTADSGLWDWLLGIVSREKPLARYDGDVEVLDPTGSRTVAHWHFTRGLPLKVAGPSLNARTGEIAMEELHIAHEGLRLESNP